MGPIATAGIGVAAGAANNLMDIAFNKVRQKQNLDFQKKSLAQQNEAQFDLWQKTNYSEQVKQLEKAGLNPGLLYGLIS